MESLSLRLWSRILASPHEDSEDDIAVVEDGYLGKSFVGTLSPWLKEIYCIYIYILSLYAFPLKGSLGYEVRLKEIFFGGVYTPFPRKER